jgi:hypothetical protein
MLARILPPQLDNSYRGHRLAIWILVLILVLKTGIALGVMLNGRAAAQNADGIPLDTYAPAAAAAFLSVFAAWGLAQLFLCALGWLAVARYRAMIPLAFTIYLLEHVARRIVFLVKPIARGGAPPGLLVNIVLLVFLLAGLVLALRATPPEAVAVT